MEKIRDCEIRIGEFQNEVYVTYYNDKTEKIFSYYADELTFSSEEFLGLTKEQALNLFHKKDVEYLQN